jgi:glycosyltransferase involved in cell wall biosynthesis
MDHLVVGAAYLRDEMREFDPQFPCTYLAYGIPLPTGTPPRSPNPKDPLRLLYYGRFENASKGVRLFPEIAGALKRRRIPFIWTIHGYGPEEEFLRQALATEIQQGQIRFSAPVSYEKLTEMIRNHDVYLLTSTNEGGPLTLLESMSLGLVPVCGNIPCLIQEVITMENGFRVPRDEPYAYAEAIFKLHADRNLLESMSRAAKATITNEFSAEAMAQRYVDFISRHAPGVTHVEWPSRIEAKPMLGSSTLFGFAQKVGILRYARRLLKRFKH